MIMVLNCYPNGRINSLIEAHRRCHAFIDWLNLCYFSETFWISAANPVHNFTESHLSIRKRTLFTRRRLMNLSFLLRITWHNVNQNVTHRSEHFATLFYSRHSSARSDESNVVIIYRIRPWLEIRSNTISANWTQLKVCNQSDWGASRTCQSLENNFNSIYDHGYFYAAEGAKLIGWNDI